MTFITQPKKEGEEKTCGCDAELVGRLTDYKGRFPDKLQWQEKESRKAHYDKDGNCKDLTNNGAIHVPDNTSSIITQESTVETATAGEPHANNDDIAYIKNKVDLMFAMISEQFHDYQERKPQ